MLENITYSSNCSGSAAFGIPLLSPGVLLVQSSHAMMGAP